MLYIYAWYSIHRYNEASKPAVQRIMFLVWVHCHCIIVVFPGSLHASLYGTFMEGTSSAPCQHGFAIFHCLHANFIIWYLHGRYIISPLFWKLVLGKIILFLERRGRRWPRCTRG